jgi:hypothetical protein
MNVLRRPHRTSLRQTLSASRRSKLCPARSFTRCESIVLKRIDDHVAARKRSREVVLREGGCNADDGVDRLREAVEQNDRRAFGRYDLVVAGFELSCCDAPDRSQWITQRHRPQRYRREIALDLIAHEEVVSCADEHSTTATHLAPRSKPSCRDVFEAMPRSPLSFASSQGAEIRER